MLYSIHVDVLHACTFLWNISSNETENPNFVAYIIYNLNNFQCVYSLGKKDQ